MILVTRQCEGRKAYGILRVTRQVVELLQGSNSLHFCERATRRGIREPEGGHFTLVDINRQIGADEIDIQFRCTERKSRYDS